VKFFSVRILITILLTSIFCPVFSQSFSTYNYSVAEGLPSTETYEVFQDSKGFLWFGTDNGVCRFDGKEFEVFNVKDGLSYPVVFGFSEDHLGRIWFRTYSGKISYFHNGRIYHYKYNDLLFSICESRIILSLHYDSLNQLWFTAGHITGKIDDHGVLDTTRVSQFAVEVKPVENHDLLSLFGPTQKLRTFRYGNKSYTFQQADVSQTYHVVCSGRWNNKLYFSVNSSVYEYNGTSLKRVYAGKAPIICIDKDDENNLWIGYLGHGAERFRGNFNAPDLAILHDKSVTKILQDHEGGVWVTTLENGAYYMPNMQIGNFKPPSYAKIRTVLSAPGTVVTGDATGRVNVFDDKTGKIIWEKKFSAPILSAYRLKNGDLWISTTTRIYQYNATFRLKGTIEGGRVAFLEKPDGHVLCISGNKICVFDAAGNLVKTKHGPSIYRSISLRDSLIFFVNRSGLHVRDQDLALLKDPAELKNFKISQLTALNDSIFLVSTIGNGFMLLNTNTWTTRRYDSRNSFNADNIYAVLVTGSLLWLGTEKGMAVARLASILEGDVNFDFLTKRSGLVSDRINFLVSAHNSVWAFSEEGISVVPNTQHRYASKKPLFFLRPITANEKKIADHTNLSLAYDQNNLQFEYTCISFNNPNILVRYRLSAEEPWHYSGARKLLFSSLAPGNYIFELEYSPDNISWSAALAPVPFTIRQPWWNRWYNQVLALASLLLLSYWYFKYQRRIYHQKNHYLKIINEHQQKLLQSEVVTLERERNRIAKELHDRVGTNLTAIKLIVSQLLKNYREPLAQDIEDQFQIALRDIKDIIYGLTPPSLERYGLFTGLKNYIGRLNKSIPIAIALKTFGKEINNHELNIIVFRVLQELLTNSIKHSFARHITIHMNAFEDVLNIVYEDDGVGFSYDPLQSGLGLDNIESRIQSINGTLKFESGDFGISYTIDIPVTLNKEVV
jgi:signal transduction histidine kinase